MEAFTVKETENECRKSLSFIEQTDRDGCSPRKQLIRTQSRIDEGFWADLQKQPEHRERKCKTLQNAWRQQFSIGKSNKSFRSLSKYILLCEHWVRFTKKIPSYKKDKHVCVCVCFPALTQQVFEHSLVLVPDAVKCAPAGPAIWQGVFADPSSTGVLVKILTWVGRAVQSFHNLTGHGYTCLC